MAGSSYRWTRRVGPCISLFEACSAFTHVTACTLAESPCDPLTPKAPAASLPPPLPRLLPGGANQFPGGTFTRCGPAPFTAHLNEWLTSVTVIGRLARKWGRRPVGIAAPGLLQRGPKKKAPDGDRKRHRSGNRRAFRSPIPLRSQFRSRGDGGTAASPATGRPSAQTTVERRHLRSCGTGVALFLRRSRPRRLT